MHICVQHVCVQYVCVHAGDRTGRKRVLDLWESELLTAVSCHVVLVPEPGSFARGISAFNY